MKRLLGAKSLEAGAYNARYDFRCYYANELVSGRVCKNGNRALFFEPLLANSMFLYIYAARLIYDYVAGGQTAAHCNGLFVKAVQEMEDVISYYYKGGSNFETEILAARPLNARARGSSGGRQFFEYLGKIRELKSRGLMHAAPRLRVLSAHLADRRRADGLPHLRFDSGAVATRGYSLTTRFTGLPGAAGVSAAGSCLMITSSS